VKNRAAEPTALWNWWRPSTSIVESALLGHLVRFFSGELLGEAFHEAFPSLVCGIICWRRLNNLELCWELLALVTFVG
jgi:hypothetical protein